LEAKSVRKSHHPIKRYNRTILLGKAIFDKRIKDKR